MRNIIKNVITFTLCILVLSAVVPMKKANLFSNEAYASTDVSKLTSLKLKTSGGSNIKLYDKSGYHNDDKVDDNDIEPDTRYYARTSSRRIKIDIDGVDDDYVRMFIDRKSGVKVGSSASLSSGTNTVTVRVYNSKPSGTVKYSSDDSVAYEYTIKVKCTYDDDDDDDESYDDIYLKDISLSDGNLDFYKKTNSYDVYVGLDVSKITIKAKPYDDDEDDYTVEIDGTEVDEGDNYKRKVSLSRGKNTIEVKVEDDDNDDYRIYKLYIYRGQTNSSSSSTNNDSDEENNGEVHYNPITSSPVVNTGNQYTSSMSNTIRNQWVYSSGKWEYVDSLGKALTNTWYYDSNYGAWFYLKSDGAMATGWLYINGNWYYMYSNGVMAKDTWIGSYRLTSDGSMA